ncbi:MAG: hypothetical protein AAF797_03810 [Planctomycetota bacterium]
MEIIGHALLLYRPDAIDHGVPTDGEVQDQKTELRAEQTEVFTASTACRWRSTVLGCSPPNRRPRPGRPAAGD